MVPAVVTQSGWAILPAIGADGIGGGALITIGVVAPEVHPDELVTV